MMYFLTSACESASALRAIYLVKTLIGSLSIIVPIILIVSLMINITKAIINNNNDILAKIEITIKNKILAALIVFLVPTIVNLALSTIDAQNVHMLCYNNANLTYITLKSEEEKALKELEKEQRRQEVKAKQKQLAEEKRQKALNKAINDSYNNDSSSNNYYYDYSEDYNNPSNNNGTPGISGGYTGESDISNQSGTVTTTNIVAIDVTDLAVPLYYSDHVTVFKTLSVNSAIQNEIHNILNNVSKYVKQNQDMIPRFETAGAYVNKSGYHGRGLAIDLFNNWSIVYNGKTYYPYANYGPSSWTNYNNFICEVCNGKENCKYNINYIIYEKYFKGNGWCWGGNWGTSYHDPMHFELTDGGSCSTNNRPQISC